MSLLLCVCVQCILDVTSSFFTADPCASASDCNSCVNNKLCFFCAGNDPACESLSTSNVFSGGGKNCKKLIYNWGTCKVKAYAFLIAIVFGIVLFLLGCCCCICCCVIVCVKRRKRTVRVEEYKATEERALIHEKSAARKADRKARNDEVRQKYGLL